MLRTLPSNSIDLIYIDPPFFSGAEYNVIWGDTSEVRTFSDTWDGGLPTYLVWLNARLWEMRRVLKDTGSIYVHCDWHTSHYIKAEMDKIFGFEHFRNEIVWRRSTSHSDAQRYGQIHDVIFWYSKTRIYRWQSQYRPYSEEYVKKYFRFTDTDGRLYWKEDATGAGDGPPRRFGDRLIAPPAGRHWRWIQETIDDYWSRGRFVLTKTGKPEFKRYLDEQEGEPVPDVWDDIKRINQVADERIGYPTQKPEALLERIVSGSSNAGDIVADFFCGGGTAPAVAQRLGRRWIACDSSRVSVSVTLNRIVNQGEDLSGVKSNYGQAGSVQTRLQLPETKTAIPDIRVNYVGVYPMDRFKAVDQAEFERFVVACLAAQLDNSDDPISGWRSAREPLRVGPSDPNMTPDAKDVQAFFEAVVRKHLQPNVRTIARYVCWRASPELIAYRKRLADYIRKNIQPRGTDMDFDFLFIDSEEFRERIRQKYPDADDNEFLLRFTKEPVVGEVAATNIGPRRYQFVARDTVSTNAGGYLINCQWDFDYERGYFAADSAYILSRRELKGLDAKKAGHKFEAALEAEHTFPKVGTHIVACRLQDNLGAEAIRTLKLEVTA